MMQSFHTLSCQTRHAVILAAGESRRTRPLTLHRPKPLIPLLGQPLLAHILDELVGIVERVTLVVGYRAEDIQACFGKSYRGMNLRYVRQTQVTGTASALMAVASQVAEPFFLLYGDNLVSRVDLLRVCQQRPSMAALPVDDPQAFGILETADGQVHRIIEKPAHAKPGSLANPGIFHLDPTVFPLLQRIQPSPRGEYELTDVVELLAQEHSFSYSLCAGHWIPVGTPWDVLVASAFLLECRSKADPEIDPQADVDEQCVVSGAVRIGRARLAPGCRVIGPAVIGDGAVLGPGSFVDRAVIGRGAHLQDNSVVTNSVIGRSARVGEGAVVQSSVLDDGASLGEQVRLPAHIFTEPRPIAHTSGLLSQSVLCRRGAVLGRGVSIAAHTSVEPGSVLFPQG